MSVRFSLGIAAALLVLLPSALPSAAQNVVEPDRRGAPFELDLSTALRWTPLGPFDAGRITAIDGSRSRPNVVYAGAAGGGVWKTTDYGGSWRPMFDAPPSGIVTAIAVAPSNPNVVYAAVSAGGADDDAWMLYTTADGGVTWTAIGSVRWRRVADVEVDATDHQQLLVAGRILGDAVERGGLFRSTDGGATFERVLDADADINDVLMYHDQPALVLATGTTGDRSVRVFRSDDRGATWRPVEQDFSAGAGTRHTSVDTAVAAHGTDAFLAVTRTDGTALYRSVDAGQSWNAVGHVPRATDATGRPAVAVAPSGRIFLVAAGRVWASTDNGATFTPSQVVPTGRDDSFVWHHPSIEGVMLVAGRPGAIVTVNGGETWSSERALPAAEVERVSVDAAFPYRVCATQGSGTACAPHRTDRGWPVDSDWQLLPAWLVRPVPDPLDANIVFGGTVVRHDRASGQSVDLGFDIPDGVSRPPAVLAFSADGRTLYAGSQAVWRTTNGGHTWTAISPAFTSGSASHVSALAVSPIDGRTIWVGLDDGRLHVTGDGGQTWLAGSRPVPSDSSTIREIEPSRFDSRSAYVVVVSTGPTGVTSRLLRTRDGGSTWADIGANLPGAAAVHVVREDPFRRGLLFAGTDQSVVMSFDDGEHWLPLQLNLPATSVRDLVVKDADLIAGTGGRGVWLLEDISPLRQLTADIARAPVFLFRAPQAWRVRATGASRAPTSPAEDPFEGVLLTYLLGEAASGEVTLDIVETATGEVIRRFSSSADANASPPRLATTRGLHRVRWDLRYTPPEPDRPERTGGTRVLPGTYQVRLVVGDQPAVRQAVSIRMDPRVRTSVVDLTAQRDLNRAIDRTRATLRAALVGGWTSPNAGSIEATLDELDQLARVVQQADVRPSARIETAVQAALTRSASVVSNGR